MNEIEPVKREKEIDSVIMSYLLELNSSIAILDSFNKIKANNKPQSKELFRIVYENLFKLKRLVSVSLTPELNKEITQLRQINIEQNYPLFIEKVTYLTDKINAELSDSGMIDIRVRKTTVFPIDFFVKNSDYERNDPKH